MTRRLEIAVENARRGASTLIVIRERLKSYWWAFQDKPFMDAEEFAQVMHEERDGKREEILQHENEAHS